MGTILRHSESAEEGLEELARDYAQLLAGDAPFVVWLDGQMGAGKSTFTRNMLWALGLDRRIPVVSPTYTLMNEYQIGKDWYAHLDLYRAEDNFSLEELGVADAREYRGMFVEWPETPTGETLEPTHKIEIRFHGEDRRTYKLERL